MTNVERVERDIAREKMFREAFMNGKEPTDEDRAAWALAAAILFLFFWNVLKAYSEAFGVSSATYSTKSPT